MEIRSLGTDDLAAAIGAVDRSEEVSIGYSVVDGALVARPVDWVVPPWSPTGAGEHSVGGHVEGLRPVLARGGVLLGAGHGGVLCGVAVVEPSFEPGLAWLAFLHVSRTHRRRGAGTALWDGAVRRAREAGAREVYVSATPTGSAVGFYLSRGCRLAAVPHRRLFAEEPEDVHLILCLAE